MKSKSIVEEVLGITDLHNLQQSLEQAHMTLTGEPLAPSPAEGRQWNDLSRAQKERAMDVRDIGDLILRRDVQTATTLADWPAYNRMMEEYGERPHHSTKALMIGTLHALSARSFECLAKTEYGASESFIVDPHGGPDKLRHGKFVYGSGLALPFAPESMDFVHTNRLLHMIEDPSSENSTNGEMADRLLSEINRVLVPGGQILMQETVPYIDQMPYLDQQIEYAQSLAHYIGHTLNGHGVHRVFIEFGKVIPSNYYLFDPARQFNYPFANNDFGTLSIYAQKPHESPLK